MKLACALVSSPLLLVTFAAAQAPPSFVNFESPHVHPIEITPDGSKLLAVNTADNRLEVFDISAGTPVATGSVPVGLDPVSVRARSATEAWVVNRISDSVSIVNLTLLNVKATLKTGDQPADVIFAGRPQRAFVSCAMSNTVLVFDPANTNAAPTVLPIAGDRPRALAVNRNGRKVYVAIFESGNQSTIIGSAGGPDLLRNFVNDPAGPYGGENPPPNRGTEIYPAQNPANPPPPKVGQIVRKDSSGRWVDDNAHDWTEFVSGESARKTEREEGWDVEDNDLAIIDTTTLSVSYRTALMNICMAVGVNTAANKITVVGTEATNQVRFAPNLKSRFVRVNLATVDGLNPLGIPPVLKDLNTHLTYSDQEIAQQSDPATASQSLRDSSIGDPRAIVWNLQGTKGYVAGMGSNNVIVIDAAGTRIGSPIEVGEGPTGLALNSKKSRLYVMNKFAASISTVNTTTAAEISRVSFHDPTPPAITVGRKHLYDTHATSGLGQISCASCHVDARMDRIAWDLGDPQGVVSPFDQNCVMDATTSCEDFHPMKGPMVTQTLQDIVGNEPFHWRGDKNGLEEFSAAFMELDGDDREPTATEMQEFEDFLETIHFPPNPFRNFDNTLPTDLALPGQFATGDLGLLRGTPLPHGNPVNGLALFRFQPAHGAGGVPFRACGSCHTLPTGTGTDSIYVGTFPEVGGHFEPYPTGPDGEHHASMTTISAGTFKIPQLRNEYEKVGFDRTNVKSRSGFGNFHNGAVSMSEFFADFILFPQTDQQSADIIAFMMAFSGSDLPAGDPNDPLLPPGSVSRDTPASVGAQQTVDGVNKNDPGVIQRLADMAALADGGKVGFVAKGRRSGVLRGYTYLGVGVMQSDHAGETATVEDLRLGAAAGSEITFTVVPLGSETRIGIDRDLDGILDSDDL